MLKLHVKYLLIVMLGIGFLAHADYEPQPFTQKEQESFLNKIYAEKLPLGLSGFMVDYVKNYGTNKAQIIESGILDLDDNQIIKIYQVAEKIGLMPLQETIKYESKNPEVIAFTRSPDDLLWYGIINGDLESVKMAVQRGADINKIDKDTRQKPLDQVIVDLDLGIRDFAFVKFFIDNGATLKNPSRAKFFYDMAIARKDGPVAEFLKQHVLDKVKE